MVRDGTFSPWSSAGLLWPLAGGVAVLLLMGDFGTAGLPRRPVALVLLGGRAALIIWSGWLAAVLLA